MLSTMSRRVVARGLRPSTLALHRVRMCQSAAAQPEVKVTIEGHAAASSDEETAEVALEKALRPKEIVEQLDRYIIGQPEAKRAVAVAMRNRWRRQRVASPLKEEISPKNILMIGPTGCGKTEVARRLAKLAQAPFIKVEATKFTEVGFVGKDVDQIIRDLVDVALALEKTKALDEIKDKVASKVEERILDALVGTTNIQHNREAFRNLLRNGHLDDRLIEIEVPEKKQNFDPAGQGGNGMPMNEIIVRFDKMMGGNKKMEKREMQVRDSIPILEEAEAEKMISEEEIKRRAHHAVEQEGIVFIDEIDKICSRGDFRGSADASSEGVQRDLLPLLEGSVVSTKQVGNVKTDHILFIASGAFHFCKPSDLLAELQGRLPIRVELKPLSENDLYRILTEPDHNLVKQQNALMEAEGVQLDITDGAKKRLAHLATQINREVENIGARRLHTLVERLMEDLSFSATERAGEKVTMCEEEVDKAIGSMLGKTDLSRFIL